MGRSFASVVKALATRQVCGALKCIEYNQSAGLLEVFHIGTHKCQAKPRPDEDDKFLEDNIKQFGTTNWDQKNLQRLKWENLEVKCLQDNMT